MGRIDSLGEAFQFPVPDRKRTQKKEKAKAREFSRLLESAQEDEGLADTFSEPEQRRTVEELLDGVFASGDDLKKGATLDRIKEYRRKVKAFLAFVTSHMLSVEQSTSGANILKRKRFTLVRVIDEKLENLTMSVISNQREQLDILAQIDEVNGLLVDLVS